MSLRNPLAKAHNHGSAGEGVGHWWALRFTAILLVLLTVWLIYAMASLIGADHATAVAWIGRPFNAAMAILFVVTSIYHGELGLQVVIEDYIHTRATEIMLMVLIRIASIVGGLLAVIAILKMAFGV